MERLLLGISELTDCVGFSSALPLLVFTQPHRIRRLLGWKFPFTAPAQRGSTIIITHSFLLSCSINLI